MLRMLEQALVIERFRNLHAAAKSLDVSASTLSRGLQALEAELGVPLFNRARNMEPTEFGHLVLARARHLLSDAETMRKDIVALRGLAVGTLSIASGPLVAQTWLYDAVARLTSRHTGISVRVDEVNWWRLPEVLAEGIYDIGVGEMNGANMHPEIVFEPLPHRSCVFFCRAGHPLTGINAPTIEEIAAYPLASPRLPARAADVLPSLHKFGTVHPTGRYFEPHISCESINGALRVVAQTDAVCVTLPDHISDEIAKGRVVALPFRAPWLRSNYSIMHLRGRMLSAPAEAFRAAAVAAEQAYFGRP